MLKPLTLLLLMVCNAVIAGGQNVKLDFNIHPDQKNYGQVVLDLPFDLTQSTQPKKLLSLYVGDKAPSDARFPAIAGNYLIRQGNLVFTPRFPPVPDQSYTVVFNAQLLDAQYPRLEKATYQLSRYIKPLHFTDKPEVTQILPLSETVPQNVLRFYLYFSQPMSLDNPYKYLSLLNQEDKVVVDAFVEFSEGLWDQSRTRLTVFIHPGRIKRGVGPNVNQGPVFIEGQRYRLKVDKQFKDFRGLELADDFYKDIVVAKPLYQKIDPQQWQLDLPEAQSRQPLVIKPLRILDPVLALRLINLVDVDSDTVIKGKMRWNKQGTHLLFEPQDNWQQSHYQVQLGIKLEDLSGNTPGWVFDSETAVEPVPEGQQDFAIAFKL